MVKTRISYRTIDTNGIRRQRIKFPKLERKLARSNYVRIRGTRFSTIVLLDEQKYFSEVLFSGRSKVKVMQAGQVDPGQLSN